MEVRADTWTMVTLEGMAEVDIKMNLLDVGVQLITALTTSSV